MNDAMQHNAARPDPPKASLDAQTLVRLKRMLLFTNEDEQYLTMAGAILMDHTDDILNNWYDYMLKNNYLAYYFTKKGEPDTGYLQTLRPHFRKWIHGLCTRQEGTTWWQFEERIAAQLQLKNTPGDNLEPLPMIFLRYLSTFIYPVAEAGRSYLSRHDHPAAEVERMHQAWFKAVSFSVLLWVYPDGLNAPF
ncbi:protoglobin [Chitinophaga niastensis]|uniref:Protoglobin n=1 Tax=Chitinophaga niastensis TaxID=536980 RepID=A0A2P8HTQ6_CHINA|nr:protoglobin domain-containing protein [Chitinophaga niastensis]PSL49565.1 protoglobin [Chitinophaga niastensis]